METAHSGHTIVVFKTNLCHVFNFYKLLQTHKDVLLLQILCNSGMILKVFNGPSILPNIIRI